MKPNKVPPTPDRTDRGVIHPSNRPDQARRDSEQNQQFGRDMERINRQAEKGQK